MKEIIIAAGLLALIISCTMLQEALGACKRTSVCKLSEATTDAVFDCIKRGHEGTEASCIKKHEATCDREPGFVCGREQALPCTLAFAEQEVAACAP